MKRLCAISMLLVLTGCVGVSAQELSVNKWITLYDGEAVVPVHARISWIPEMETGFVWPCLADQRWKFHLFSPDRHGWRAVEGTYPESYAVDRRLSPQAYVYLAGLKKVLLLQQEWHYAKNKTPVYSWLLDPRTGAWQPLEGDLSMCDSSADFNPSPGRDGRRVPAWGTLVYDGFNQEALSFGGGGTWGRVGKIEEKLKVGDWFYDESSGRIRRLTAGATDIREARRWFPAHCGTWVFSENARTWKPIAQPLGNQPSGRILAGMAYDQAEGKIVLFGGDDQSRCFGDTWVYDCRTHTWSNVKPGVAPPARAAHAMVYVPDQKVVLLAGGYGGGWKPLSDVWAYETGRNRWTRLDLNLPVSSQYCSAAYDPQSRMVVLVVSPKARYNKSTLVYGLHLDVGSAKKAAVVKHDAKMDYHCKSKSRPTPLPGEWLSGDAGPEDEKLVRARLKGLPANLWKEMKFPWKAPERNWGSYIYDVRNHRAFAWGGGHSAYPGAEMSEYDLLTNRWRGMADVTNYNPLWLHGMVGGPPGVSLGGWSLLSSHARKSYGVDVLSDSVITFVGDVYSIKSHMFVANIGRAPGRYGYSDQVAFVSTPHGLYSYGSAALHRADVAKGMWKLVAEGGPPRHHEYSHLCYDSSRDRIIYFYADARVWVFDFKSKTWEEEKPTGKTPAKALGDSTYVPEMNAALMVFAESEGVPEKLYFYKVSERKWYTAPSVGDPFRRSSTSGRDYSPHYDPELSLVVRVTPTGFHRWVAVHVMRLEAEALKLTPVE